MRASAGRRKAVPAAAINALKDAVTEALAAHDTHSRRPMLNTESPADMAMRLLDDLITGEEAGGVRWQELMIYGRLILMAPPIT